MAEVTIGADTEERPWEGPGRAESLEQTGRVDCARTAGEVMAKGTWAACPTSEGEGGGGSLRDWCRSEPRTEDPLRVQKRGPQATARVRAQSQHGLLQLFQGQLAPDTQKRLPTRNDRKSGSARGKQGPQRRYLLVVLVHVPVGEALPAALALVGLVLAVDHLVGAHLVQPLEGFIANLTTIGALLCGKGKGCRHLRSTSSEGAKENSPPPPQDSAWKGQLKRGRRT